MTAILNEMSPDDRTALFEELPGPAVKQLMDLLTPPERAIATKLLGYPEESVGRLMTPDYIAVRGAVQGVAPNLLARARTIPATRASSLGPVMRGVLGGLGVAASSWVAPPGSLALALAYGSALLQPALIVAMGVFFLATPFVPRLNREWRPDAPEREPSKHLGKGDHHDCPEHPFRKPTATDRE